MKQDDEPRLERVPTGIPGLDTILNGGFVRGGIYIVAGVPGAGKTIFGNQLCFNHVKAGGKAAFVTLLSESHARMMLNLNELSFFDESVIPKSLYYLSAFAALESEGLKGLLELVRREVRGHGASVLVIDGLVAVEESAESDQQFKKFIHELQNQSSLSQCTTFLLTSGGTRIMRPEKTMVDGLIELSDELESGRRDRKFDVTKFRGSRSLRGQHSFEITDDGILIHPRIEALLARPSRAGVCPSERISTGVSDLDVMLGGGGLPRGSTSMVLGPPGAGKTSLGLHFMSQCDAQHRGVYFSFYETRERAIEKAERLSLPIAEAIRKGHVEYIWNPTTENTLDALGNQLVDVAGRIDAHRIFIDGLDGFRQTMSDPSRLARFFTAIANEFRAVGRTTLYTAESRSLMGTEIEAPPLGISTVLDNWISVRIAEIDSRLRRVVSVLKVRDSDFDATIRELIITDNGIGVGGPFKGVDGVLAGATRRQPMSRKRQKPVAKPRVKSKPTRKTGRRSQHRMHTILIVDDEFGIAESVGSLFSDEGFRVFTAVNGKQGLEKLSEIKADIVLIDYMMPVMNGGEMLQALRAQARYAALPVVLMSGVAEAIVKQDPLALDYTAFIRKPFDAFKILAIVRRLLGIDRS